jgi:hypothetical protein
VIGIGLATILVSAILAIYLLALRKVASSQFGLAAGSSLPALTPDDRTRYLDLAQTMGVKMIRFDLDWNAIQHGSESSYDWGPRDAVVQAASDRGISILADIAYTPPWARPAGTTDKYPPTNVSDYGTFCGLAARRYVPMGVHAFEVWNEPNTASFFMPSPDVVKYTQMLKACYTAIKAVDPAATVVTGGTAPAGSYDDSGSASTVNPINWLQGIYANGGGGYFDAVGHHPYSFPYDPSTVATWSAWYQMFGTSPNLRSVMVAHGDGDKQIWATEWGAPTDGPAGSGAVSEATQAAQLARAFSMWQTYPWAGPLFVYDFRDNGTNPASVEDFFGLVRHDWSPKPAYRAYQAAAHA